MPKPRTGRAAAGAPSYFAVSPWQDKDAGKDSEAGDEDPAGYTEVEERLVVAAAAGRGSGSAGGGGSAGATLHAGGNAAAASTAASMAVDATDAGALPKAAAEGPAAAASVAGVGEVEPAAARTAAAATAPAAAAGGGWQIKKRKPPEEDGTLPAGADGGMTAEEACALPARGGPPGEGDVAAAAGEQAQQAAELEGTAYLALLPNGSITGHLVCAPSALTGGGRRRSFGLMGEVVVAGRECTRDADWGVLRVTLISFACLGGAAGGSGGGGGGGGGYSREISFLAERTEGDAMRLRAPVPWQGIELEELPALDATCTCPSSAPGGAPTLEFRCSQLLTGEAGEALLRRLQPSLAGRGALLNVGDMRVGLPAEAAAALLGAAAPPALAQRCRGGPSPPPLQRTPPPQQQRQRQQQYTGRGSGGSGRAVRDAEDDW